MTRVVFVLTDKEYSGDWIQMFMSAFTEVAKKGHEIVFRHNYNQFPHFAKASALGAISSEGPDQKPFQGKIEFDVIMFIGSQCRFKADDVLALIDSPHPVTTGHFSLNGEKSCILKSLDNLGEFMPSKEIDELPEDVKYIDVEFSSLEFAAVKSEVFDKLDYPWFYNAKQTNEMPTDELSFAQKCLENGVKIQVDKSVKVGHSVEVVI